MGILNANAWLALVELLLVRGNTKNSRMRCSGALRASSEWRVKIRNSQFIISFKASPTKSQRILWGERMLLRTASVGNRKDAKGSAACSGRARPTALLALPAYFYARTLVLVPSRNSAQGRCYFAVSPPSMPTGRLEGEFKTQRTQGCVAQEPYGLVESGELKFVIRSQ